MILYPNISALPLPAAIVNAYQGLLPTYLYAFQFAVNTIDRRGATAFADSAVRSLLVVALVVACAVVGYCAWVWRDRARRGRGPRRRGRGREPGRRDRDGLAARARASGTTRLGRRAARGAPAATAGPRR